MILTPLEAARRRAGRFALWIAMCERRRQSDRAKLERALAHAGQHPGQDDHQAQSEQGA